MKENISGFMALVGLNITVPLIGATIQEAIHIAANHKAYKEALLILAMGFVALILGSLFLGILKNIIKKWFTD